MIKYSVIIPHKNCPELLNRCLSSIPCDDSYEIILIDDGSDDREYIRCQIENLSLPNLSVFYSEFSRGAGYSRNVGLEHAHGEWILFLDADDFFSEDINDIVSNTQNNDVDIVFFDHRGRYSDNLEECQRFPARNTILHNYIEKPCEMTELSLKFGDTVPWGKIYRRNLIAKNNIKFDEIMCCEDVMFTTKCALHAQNILVVNQVGYNITFRRDSLSMIRSINHQYTAFKTQLERNTMMIEYGHPELCCRVLSFVLLAFRLYGFKETKRYYSTLNEYNQNLLTGIFMSWSEIREKIRGLFDKSYHKN